MKTKLFFGMLTAAATLAVAPAVFADSTVTVNEEFTIGYQRGQLASEEGSFTGTSYTTTGEVGGYTLVLPSGNVYFTGTSEDGNDSLTITSITDTPNSSGATYKTHDAFIVEGTTVILNGTGVDVSELGLNLCIGTMEDATLKITGGAKVSTGAYLSAVGANLATGTIIIDGTGSTLATQQITLGTAVDSLAGIGENPALKDPAVTGDYWTRDMYVDDSTYNAVLAKLTGEDYDSTTGSYGIVKVTDGGTWTVGVGNSNTSNSRLQLSNGEITIDGSGSQLLLGGGSSLMMSGTGALNSDGNNVTGIHYTEKITVINGGKVACAEDAKLYQIAIGDNYYASTDVVEISVSGKDTSGNASTFDLTISDTAWIGSYAGYWDSTTGVLDGGTENVKITASDGGVFKISANDCVAIAADNYMDNYFWANVTGSKYGHSYGITVSLSADSGGLIELNALNGTAVALGAGSPAEGGDYKNNVNVTADNATVSISGGDIYANYGIDGTNTTASENVYVNLKATNGGEMTLSAVAGEKQGFGTIVFNKNTAVTVEKGSSLITEGKVLFNEGSSISVDATSTWTTKDAVTFNKGSKIEVGAAAAAEGTNDVSVALGSVTIAEGASITVTIDISSLDNYTSASVAILTAESIIFGSSNTALEAGSTLDGEGHSDSLASFVKDYIVCEGNGFTIDSWSYTADGTLYANISTMPEPSMFGMLFGLSALGLVSTRRRRRKA